MIVDIPDEWIKKLLNSHPDMSIDEALKSYLRSRDESMFSRHFIFAIGEYVLHEMGKNLK